MTRYPGKLKQLLLRHPLRLGLGQFRMTRYPGKFKLAAFVQRRGALG